MIHILKNLYYCYIIKRSGLFDRDYYLENYPEVRRAKTWPLIHFLLHGWKKGYNPNPKFKVSQYLANYQGLREANINPLVHYISSGWKEGREVPGIKPDFSTFLKEILLTGCCSIDSNHDTVLVATHQASRTGAAILSLNIVKYLKKEYNVITVLLGDGPLVKQFLEESILVAGPFPPQLRSSSAFADDVIEKFIKEYQVKFAIINSIESQAVLTGLARHFIPTIQLIHEFASYIWPKDRFIKAALWSSKTIYSTQITYENAVFEHPGLEQKQIEIIPQGLYDSPEITHDIETKKDEVSRLLKVFKPTDLSHDTITVLGVGTVEIRKGVDLFIGCAANINRINPEKQIRFIWVGDHYDPENDMRYSVYLAEQIRRSGLENSVFILKGTPCIETAYQLADLFLLSSRLDPLPGVAFEAMAHKLPVLCFDKATGIAEILIQHGFKEDCVASYMDVSEMSKKIIAFAESKTSRDSVGEQLYRLVTEKYQMENYVDHLKRIGLALRKNVDRERNDIAIIKQSEQARLDYFLPYDIEPQDAYLFYVRSWANQIRRRKLFPGFHPGIFLDNHGIDESGEDPLAHYLRTGQPDGPWKYEVISPGESVGKMQDNKRIALHIFINHLDRFPEILERVSNNFIHPDLFISITEIVSYDAILQATKNYSGNVIDIEIVPNTERELVVFFNTVSRKNFEIYYDICGHVNCRKTGKNHGELEDEERNFYFENLIGGKHTMADVILAKMKKNPQIGMVFPDDPNILVWDESKPYSKAILNLLNFDNLPTHYNFLTGTMFWAQVKALLPIYDLKLPWGVNAEHHNHLHTEMMNKIERIMPLMMVNNNFKIALTNVKDITNENYFS